MHSEIYRRPLSLVASPISDLCECLCVGQRVYDLFQDLTPVTMTRDSGDGVWKKSRAPRCAIHRILFTKMLLVCEKGDHEGS